VLIGLSNSPDRKQEYAAILLYAQLNDLRILTPYKHINTLHFHLCAMGPLKTQDSRMKDQTEQRKPKNAESKCRRMWKNMVNAGPMSMENARLKKLGQI